MSIKPEMPIPEPMSLEQGLISLARRFNAESAANASGLKAHIYEDYAKRLFAMAEYLQEN